jgi:hypothetical protein
MLYKSCNLIISDRPEIIRNDLIKINAPKLWTARNDEREFELLKSALMLINFIKILTSNLNSKYH